MGVTPAMPRYCPSCGGPNARAHDRACAYCHGPLLPLGVPDPREAVRCQACATSVSAGASYCPACGTALARAAPRARELACPGCGEPSMGVHGLGPTPARPQGYPVCGCRRCGGVWVDKDTLQAILSAAASAAAMPGHGTGDSGVARRQVAPGAFTRRVVYRKCPECGQQMHRRNFARVSGIIVDECGIHGTWFDAGELPDVLRFVQSGGLELGRQRDAEEQARLHRAKMTTAVLNAQNAGSGWEPEHATLGVAFSRWVGRWIGGG